jgi:hypothetical protein
LRFDTGKLGTAEILALQRTVGNRTVGQLLSQTRPGGRIQRKRNETGIPDDVKGAIERLSGYSMDNVRAHYNSAEPTQVDAVAYAHGSDIEVAPGQERHLPHEAWHVVQQMQGRVRPNTQVDGALVNDHAGLEREADVMGSRATKAVGHSRPDQGSELIHDTTSTGPSVMQLEKGLQENDTVTVRTKLPDADETEDYEAVIKSVDEGGAKYSVTFVDQYFNADSNVPKVYPEASVRRRKVAAKAAPVFTGDDAGPPWDKKRFDLSDDDKVKIKKLVGDAKTLTDLSEDQVEELIDLLAGVSNKNFHLDAFIGSLKTELKDLRENNEKQPEWEKREKLVLAETSALETEAFKTQFGVTPEEKTWQELESDVTKWWQEMQAEEGKMKDFSIAFKANRMTARQIDANQRRGQFQAAHLGSKPDKATDRPIILDNTIAGIGTRQDPTSFIDEKTINEKGMHDLSASLLRGDQPESSIYSQLKHYENAVVVFMPLPEEKDLRIFSALARVQGKDEAKIAEWSRVLTRPIYAQASDMGTRYVDTKSGSTGEGTFKYGLTGTVIRKKGDRARKINAADLAARKKGALSYDAVAKSALTKVNEVVMAYRQHQSKLFPMFAKWDKDKQQFNVVPADPTSDKFVITDKGEYKKAT